MLISGRTGVTVLNGTANGFDVGVSVSGASKITVQGMRAGLAATAGIAIASSDDSTVSGSTVFGSHGHGITVDGDRNMLTGNTVSRAALFSDGIAVLTGDANTLTGNSSTDILAPGRSS